MSSLRTLCVDVYPPPYDCERLMYEPAPSGSDGGGEGAVGRLGGGMKGT